MSLTHKVMLLNTIFTNFCETFVDVPVQQYTVWPIIPCIIVLSVVCLMHGGHCGKVVFSLHCSNVRMFHSRIMYIRGTYYVSFYFAFLPVHTCSNVVNGTCETCLA